MTHNGTTWIHRMQGAALLVGCIALIVSSAGTAAASTPATTENGLAPQVWLAPIAQSPSGAQEPNTTTIHVVRRGETLTRIARRYGVTVDAIVQANGLPSASRIYAGQQLVIPTPGSAPAPSPATTDSAPAPSPATADSAAAPSPATTGTEQVTHVVRRGETLWGIARRYGVSVDAIARANGLANVRVVYARQRLVIPVGG
ncbi:MAG: LysM peptidoglycan-binding domain-containing protein, partial [Chloroflexota bacterium]|nr:LysM peptidoglycan-binding domain-containing protein [Chloroflexota bacterium]